MKDLNQLNTGQKFFLRHQGANFKNDREKHDFYATPEIATLSLLDKEKFTGNIWECACGDGAISKVLINNGYQVISDDLVDRGFGNTGLDFLKERFGGKLITSQYEDKIEIKDKSQDLILIQHSIDTGQDREEASWLNVDKNKKNIEVLSTPSRSDASQQIEEQLIVELYSK